MENTLKISILLSIQMFAVLGFVRTVTVKVNTFIKTDSHGRHISLNKPFLIILSIFAGF